ncbi:MAG: fumarylacetoacetate hydrolase family protein [bacterium]
MKLANCLNEGTFIGLESGGGFIDLSRGIRFYSLISEEKEAHIYKIDDLFTLENPSLYLREVVDFIKTHRLEEPLYVDSPKILPPIIKPSKIVALGRNYLEHARETGYEAPKEPIFFSKSISSIVATEEDIIYPKWLTRVDPEAELGLIIGRKAKEVPKERALDYVFGYTIINDVTARDMQTYDLKSANPWFRSKSFDTFCPMGPFILLKEYVKDPHNLEIELKVNGEIRQKDNTKNLIFKIPEIISFISKHMTLEPGDVIATGTPSGIAPIYPGDIVEVSVESIGTLKNRVVREE